MHGCRQTTKREPPRDVGTLWTMRRNELTARCALFAGPGGSELRVIVDGATRMTKRCRRSEDAFALAEHWKARLAAESWQQVVPRSAAPRTSSNSAGVPSAPRRPAAGGRS
jgi:hypothetical protein